MSTASQPVPFHWQQVDQRLSSILQSKVSAEIRELITDDVDHIRFQNMHNGNSMAVPSERLQMQRLRADEWASRLYEGYCEIWQTQGMPICSEFLHGIFEHAIKVLFAARVGAITDEFVREQHRAGGNSSWLQPALEEFGRDMQRRSHDWSQVAEVDARTVRYMLESDPESPRIRIAARKVIAARAKTRTLETMITSVEARIKMAERALNGMSMTETPPYRKSSVKQSLSHLKNERKELRSALEQWQFRLQASILNAENTKAEVASGKRAVSASPIANETMQEGTQVRTRGRLRRKKVKRTLRKPAKTVHLPPYKSEWKRATKALMIGNPKMPVLDICRRLDDDAIKLPKKWAAGGNRSFEDAYRDATLRQRIHTAISKMRAELRKAGVIG